MKKSLTELKKDIVFEENLLGSALTFHTTWGLFSPHHVDEGSKLLLENIELPERGAVLDMGCGYGALGLVIAKHAPVSTVYMADKDFVAVEYAKKNVELNGAKNCEVFLSNLFDQLPEKQFDCIVSNVPAKAERELYDIFLEESKTRLKLGGKLYIVAIAGLKEFFKKNLKEVFGNYDKVKQGRSYVVFTATRT